MARRCRGLPLLAVDLLFFAANLTKLPHGAWLPLLVGIAVFTVLTTWQKGRKLVTKRRELDEGSLRAFVDQLHDCGPPLYRVPGTAIFLNRGKTTAPLALRANVEHNHVLHEHVVILAIETLPVPHVPPSDRLEIDDLGYKDDRIFHVSARFGYMDTPDVPALLPLIRQADLESPLDDEQTSPTSCPPSSCTGAHARHEPVAQAPLHRHRPADRRRGRVLPAPPRPHRHHGLTHRTLTMRAIMRGPHGGPPHARVLAGHRGGHGNLQPDR